MATTNGRVIAGFRYGGFTAICAGKRVSLNRIDIGSAASTHLEVDAVEACSSRYLQYLRLTRCAHAGIELRIECVAREEGLAIRVERGNYVGRISFALLRRRKRVYVEEIEARLETIDAV